MFSSCTIACKIILLLLRNYCCPGSGLKSLLCNGSVWFFIQSCESSDSCYFVKHEKHVAHSLLNISNVVFQWSRMAMARQRSCVVQIHDRLFCSSSFRVLPRVRSCFSIVSSCARCRVSANEIGLNAGLYAVCSQGLNNAVIFSDLNYEADSNPIVHLSFCSPGTRWWSHPDCPTYGHNMRKRFFKFRVWYRSAFSFRTTKCSRDFLGICFFLTRNAWWKWLR